MLPLEDYALIGDCETAALVGRNGSIDWLPLPSFDSPACFAALLGTPDNGRWLLAPRDAVRRVTRSYQPGTLILETRFEVDGGEVSLIDFMPVRSGQPDLVRLVVGRRGRVTMTGELVIRFDYGHVVPWVQRIDGGIAAIGGPDRLTLRAGVPLRGENLRTITEFEVVEGQRVSFDLTWQPSHLDGHPPRDVEQALTRTADWWRAWSDRCTVTGPWRDAVLRSLITLKALTFAPTGAVVAAPTTSLPECVGGVRNWDYRYCWLRDATFTLLALMNAGYTDEAAAWRNWLLRSVAGKPEQIQIMYGIRGERRLPELSLPWLPGYGDSRPVRIGNAATRQRQLDVFGELLDAVHQAWKMGSPPDGDAWHVERALIGHLESVWHEPDEGLWEMRGPRRHFTHSKMMAWVALDRAVKGIESLHLDGPLARWRAVRDAIHRDVCDHGFNASAGSFVQYYGSDRPDASLLMMPQVGFLPIDDPRVQGTVAAIERELTVDGFVQRYSAGPEVDGLPPGEATFLLCSFWLVDAMQLMGRGPEARQLFERLLTVRNDVGLLSEGYDVDRRRLAGNFPQAFSHVGLINSALNLARGRAQAAERGRT